MVTARVNDYLAPTGFWTEGWFHSSTVPSLGQIKFEITKGKA